MFLEVPIVRFPITTMEDLRKEPRRELTQEEKAKPYSKYFYKELATIPQADLDILNAGPCDPALAVPIDRRSDMLRPGEHGVEVGWCLMPDGSSFAATKVFFPGASPEMFDWWFSWHALEPLRYALWCPNCHTSIRAHHPEDLKDSSGYPLHSRNWNQMHYPEEGFTFEKSTEVIIKFFSPETYGLDPALMAVTPVKALQMATLIMFGDKIAFTDQLDDLASKAKPEDRVPFNSFFHTIQTVPGGCVLRSRYWPGKTIVDGKAVDAPLPGADLEQVAWEHCRHSLTEYNNLASILPSIYKEMNGKID